MRFLLLIAALAVVLGGCGGSEPSWNLARSTATGVVPSQGEYEFETASTITDVGHSQFKFVIESNAASASAAAAVGQPVLRFSADGVRFDAIPVDGGAFYWEWGSIGGLHSPTDSYAISGHFTEPGRAEGTVKLASGGRVIAASPFVATLTTTVSSHD